MVTSSIPMPMPAMNRHRSTPKPDDWNAMIAVVNRIPDQREGEDGASAVLVGNVAKEDGANKQAREQREHERADASDANRSQHVEHAQRFRGEVTGLVQPGCDISGQEQVIKLEAAAKRDQCDQVPDVPGHRQPIEPCCKFRRWCSPSGFPLSPSSGSGRIGQQVNPSSPRVSHAPGPARSCEARQAIDVTLARAA